jgi:hypothetical protein
MPYPKVIQTTFASGSPNSGGSTGFGALHPQSGDSMYVFIAYDAGSPGSNHVTSVSDSSSNFYAKAGAIQNTGHVGIPNPSVEVWYADNVPNNGTLIVSVGFFASTYFVFDVAIIRGVASSGSIDTLSAGQTGNSASSSDPIVTVSPDDLVIACQCTANGITSAPASGGGFTSVMLEQQSGGTASDVYVDLWEGGPAPPNDFNSSFSWTGAVTGHLSGALQTPDSTRP